MNPFKKKSDREVVEELRRVQRWRRPVGVALIAFGLVLLALHVWRAEWTKRKILEIADVSETQAGAARDRCHNSALLAYAEGFGTGASVGLGSVTGMLIFLSGVRLRFGGRKDRLLIQHFGGSNQLHQDGLPGGEL